MSMGELQPFEADAALQPFRLQADARWQQGVLALHYRLSGPLQELQLAAPSSRPARRDGLWQSSCFEAFVAVAGESGYWEINLAPSGDWNLYRLQSYRTGLAAEALIETLPFALQRQPSQLQLSLELDLSGLLPATAALEISITSVLEHRRLGCSYWALRHAGPEPDFHRRESFQPLPPATSDR